MKRVRVQGDDLLADPEIAPATYSWTQVFDPESLSLRIVLTPSRPLSAAELAELRGVAAEIQRDLFRLYIEVPT